MSKRKILIATSVVVILFFIVLLLLVMNLNKGKVVTYTVEFNTNGGTIIETQLVNSGEKVIIPSVPKRDGYIFVEWMYEDKSYDFSLGVTKNMILIAKWVEKADDKEMLVVRFDSDGGTSISNQIIEENGKVEKPVDPVKEGFVFKYWDYMGSEYNFDNKVIENINLKAIWEEVKQDINDQDNKKEEVKEENKEEELKYTVAFNSNGGSTIFSQVIVKGNKASRPDNPIRDGYVFDGWMLNGNIYNFDTPVTGDITLVANWKEVVKNNYTVTFNSNGGSSVTSQNVVEGNRVSQPVNPVREGYNFNGWTLNGSNYDFAASVNGNITLVAKWTQKSYVIRVARVDAYSPDSVLSVFEDGRQITVQSIKYVDGAYLCSGTNLTVATIDIAGETNFKVVLSGGTEVVAVVQ